MVFSRRVAKNWLSGNLESLDYLVDKYDQPLANSSGFTYLKYVKIIYDRLESSYQNEYVVKNSFINEWLEEDIDQKDTRLYSEFRVADSVVDLATFNGISKAFEIKTELDSPYRLSKQLKDYQLIFNEIYIIVPEKKLNLYDEYFSSVGVISFSAGVARNKYNLVTKSPWFGYPDSDVLMRSLHSNEYKQLVGEYYKELPNMSSFTQYDTCKSLMTEIPAEKLNDLFLKIIKRRKQKSYLSKRYHLEFNQLSLALKLSEKKVKVGLSQLDQTICE